MSIAPRIETFAFPHERQFTEALPALERISSTALQVGFGVVLVYIVLLRLPCVHEEMSTGVLRGYKASHAGSEIL